MSNSITSDRVAGSEPLRMSNGLTAVLLDVLCIAASDLATTDWHKRFAFWLAQHDQSRTGAGCVGFDIELMGWSHDDFLPRKQHVLAVIDAALAKHGWNRLGFTPREETLLATLTSLRHLVDAFGPEHIAPLDDNAWIPDELPTEMCDRHRVYLHEAGCILCNDAPVT